jgi:hypothetical protein
MYWADEQLMGLHGTNLIDFSVVNGYDPTSGEIESQNPVFFNMYPFGQSGEFANWGFGPPLGFSSLGIAGTYSDTNGPYNNIALACETYLDFPTAGIYVMGANSDDGIRVTFARNSHDLLGVQAPGMLADYGRLIGRDQNVGALIVSAPGYYGFRLLYESSRPDAGLEWYFKSTPAGVTNVLVNDVVNNPDTAVAAYQLSSGAPPYVSFAEPPLNDDQVGPDADFKWQLTDGATSVNPGSVVLKLNGITQAPTLGSSAGVTSISLPHTPGQPHASGTNVVDLSFKDSAGTSYAYNYNFVVPGPPTISIGKQANSWVITYTGTLYSSTAVNGAYSPVSGASSPYTIPTGSSPSQYYRAHQ